VTDCCKRSLFIKLASFASQVLHDIKFAFTSCFIADISIKWASLFSQILHDLHVSPCNCCVKGYFIKFTSLFSQEFQDIHNSHMIPKFFNYVIEDSFRKWTSLTSSQVFQANQVPPLCCCKRSLFIKLASLTPQVLQDVQGLG